MNGKKEIEIKPIFDTFQNHLNLSDNNRILFSGKFGNGKTYFLNKFFKEEKTEEYVSVHLYPVNYSVSRNEDIFEYIKYDILIELLNTEKSFLNEGVKLGELLKDTFTDREFQKVLARMLPKIGKYIQNGLKCVDIIKENISENLQNEGKVIDNFFDRIKKNSPYEHDQITSLIRKLLDRNSGLIAKEKQTVLIIDDLDRIDPEHIFRILNVFAAHFDAKHYGGESGDNKFDFDRIIVICDVDNIRKIFSHRYGQDTDFSGYIDKFYSKEIFQFENQRIKDFIYEKTEEILSTHAQYSFYSEKTKELLLSCFKANLLNLRSLLNLIDIKIATHEKGHYGGISLLLTFLKYLTADKTDFMNIFKTQSNFFADALKGFIQHDQFGGEKSPCRELLYLKDMTQDAIEGDSNRNGRNLPWERIYRNEQNYRFADDQYQIIYTFYHPFKFEIETVMPYPKINSNRTRQIESNKDHFFDSYPHYLQELLLKAAETFYDIDHPIKLTEIKESPHE